MDCKESYFGHLNDRLPLGLFLAPIYWLTFTLQTLLRAIESSNQSPVFKPQQTNNHEFRRFEPINLLILNYRTDLLNYTLLNVLQFTVSIILIVTIANGTCCIASPEIWRIHAAWVESWPFSMGTSYLNPPILQGCPQNVGWLSLESHHSNKLPSKNWLGFYVYIVSVQIIVIVT